MKALFQKKTVASVMATFTKTIEDLLDVHNDSLGRVSRLEDEIEQKQAEMTASQDEADRAMRVAEKLKALVNGQ